MVDRAVQQLKTVFPKSKQADLLKLHGLVLDSGGIKDCQNVTRYAIETSDIIASVIMEQRSDAWVAGHADKVKGRLKWQRVMDPSTSRSARKAMRAAIRAAYALELKEASVYLYVGAGGKTVITGIYKRQPRRLDFHIEEEKRQPIAMAADTKGLTQREARRPLIGMDPEFVLVSQQGELIFADRYLQRKGVVGCDAVMVNGVIRYALAELRPGPQLEPKRLVTQLRSALQKASLEIPDQQLIWLAGGMPVPGVPLGGHLHFSGLSLDGELIRTLDNYLALPFLMVEDAKSIKRRPRFGYLGDFREKPHGFEYRVLPSWLVSPRVAAGVLAIARLIADHHEQLLLRPLSEERFQRYFYEGDKSPLLGIVRQIWQDLEQTSGYNIYAEYLDPFKQLILQQQSWDSEIDLRTAWNL